MAKNEIKYLTAFKSDNRVKKFCRFKKYGIREKVFERTRQTFAPPTFRKQPEVPAQSF